MNGIQRVFRCRWLSVLAVMCIGGTTLPAAELQETGLLEEALNAGPVITSITIQGVAEADRAEIRQKMHSRVEEPLREETLQKDRQRIEAMDRFVVQSVTTTPAPTSEKKVRVVFQVLYAEVELDLGINDAGALSIQLGPDRLLTPSSRYPRIGRLVVPEKRGKSNKERRSFYKWARRADRTWKAEESTVTVQHEWGEYSAAYAVREDRIDLTIRVRNEMDAAIEHLRIYLTGNFSFPSRPSGYWWKHHRVMTPTPDRAPPVVFGDYGQGVVAACLPEMPDGVRFGFRAKRRLTVEFSELPAGATRTVRGSVRFGLGQAAGGDPHGLVKDVYGVFRAEHPRIGPDWPDRRPIGALHPSSSAKGLFKAGNPKNPRGWKLGRRPVDITTEEGRERFREQALDWARRCVKVCRGMNAQGVIVWSIEGQQYPHATSYLGAPDKIGRFAPEMDAVADEFFQVFSDAGLRTGVCIRPQRLTTPEEVPQSDTVKPRQVRLWDGDRIPVEEITELLDHKLTYARQRWGCSIFYVDSNVASKWAKDEKTGKWKPTRWEVMPAEIFGELARRHPDCLILPEHEYFMYWSCSAPLAATPIKVQKVWPDAFSVNLMQHFKPDDPRQVERMGGLVERGDILLFRGWFNDAANDVIRNIYKRHHNPEWHDPDVIAWPGKTD